MEDTLFINPREKDTGVITAAEIRWSKATGRKYIWATVKLVQQVEDVKCVIGRVAYTSYVIRNGLSPELSEEEYNVGLLVGKWVSMRWEHHANPEDKAVYPTAHILGVDI